MYFGCGSVLRSSIALLTEVVYHLILELVLSKMLEGRQSQRATIEPHVNILGYNHISITYVSTKVGLGRRVRFVQGDLSRLNVTKRLAERWYRYTMAITVFRTEHSLSHVRSLM